MSSYRRSRTRGGIFFFTVATYQRRPILLKPDARVALHEAIIIVRSQMPFKIHAWVLLPDHMHCIWELPPEDAAFGQRWGMIKRQVSRVCAHLSLNRPVKTAGQKRRKELLFWRRRFWEHEIRNEKDFERCMDYIHWNPVKHGYVQQASDWRFTTLHHCVRDGIYPRDWGGGCAPGLKTRVFGE